MKNQLSYTYPTPQEVGVRVPGHLMQERFCSGFHHALVGGQIDKVKHLRLSFREGYRAGKLYLREVRRRQGIVEFPMKGKLAFRSRLH